MRGPVVSPLQVLREGLIHVLVGDQQGQRRAVLAAEHAREAGVVGLGPLQDLATFVDAQAAGLAAVGGLQQTPSAARSGYDL